LLFFQLHIFTLLIPIAIGTSRGQCLLSNFNGITISKISQIITIRVPKLEARYVFSRSFQSQRKSATIHLRFSEPFNANKENPFHQRSIQVQRPYKKLQQKNYVSPMFAKL
jgi:hypothetical protein